MTAASYPDNVSPSYPINDDKADQHTPGVCAADVKIAIPPVPFTTSTSPWYRPVPITALLCYAVIITYTDVGLFASNGATGTETAQGVVIQTGMKQANHLGFGQLGLIATLFMVAAMVASGVITVLVERFSPFRIMGLSMMVWTCGVALTGASQGFCWLLPARLLAGTGLAALMIIPQIIVNDVAPDKHRGIFLDTLPIGIFTGQAIGFIVGGNLVKLLAWRTLFFMLAGLQVPVSIFCMVIPVARRHSNSSALKCPEETQGGMSKTHLLVRLQCAGSKLVDTCAILYRHPVCITVIFGFLPAQFVLNGLAFWGPKAVLQMFDVPSGMVDIIIGITVFFSALIGNIIGGVLLDKMGKSLPKGMAMSAIAAVGAMVLSIVAYALIRNVTVFFVIFALSLTALFLSGSSLYAISMWSVPEEQRAASQALRTIVHYLFGIMPAPLLIGIIQEHVHNWRVTLIGVTSYLALGALIYTVGWFFARTAPNYVALKDTLPKSQHDCKDGMCEHPEPPKLAEC